MKAKGTAQVFLFTALLVTSCTRALNECDGPAMDMSALRGIKGSAFSSGPEASLVLPNPIDAIQLNSATATDSRVISATEAFHLPGLLSPNRLETDFIKVRLHSIDDAPALLARPDSSGKFRFALTDEHYSEVMGYYSVVTAMSYVEALGFRLDKSRPLYVLARARDEGKIPTEVNAYYEHNTLNPTKPRVMRVYGEGEFAPSLDRDMFSHELGHAVLEGVTQGKGIDLAGEAGAASSEGAALHECGADYLAESLGDRPYIGKWINRNIEGVRPGEALRYAIDRSGDVGNFAKVMAFDPKSGPPERYTVAEVCTRALWAIRKQFVDEDAKTGAHVADRLVYTAVSLLKRDASIRGFRAALMQADQELHCGLHERAINGAFADRGLIAEPDTLSSPLELAFQPVMTEGVLSFKLRISNRNGETAHNVRLRLESTAPEIQVLTYMQGYGDLVSGGVIDIGNSLPLLYSPSATVGTRTSSARPRFRLRVLVENGPDTVKEGELP